MSSNVGARLYTQTYICLAWYDPDEYEKVNSLAGGRLLPYETWKSHFEAARDRFIQEYGAVLVATVSADAVLKWSRDTGTVFPVEASASYATAAAGGLVQAPVERFSRH